MSKKIFTVPNIISFIRILFIPYYIMIFLQKNYVLTLFLLIFLTTSDYIDGFLARKLNQGSKLGKLIDPVADRTLILFTYFFGSIINIIPYYFFVLIIIRDILVGIKMLKSKRVYKVNFAGKFGSFALMVCAPAFIISNIFINTFAYSCFQGLAYSTGIWGIYMYYIAGFEYIVLAKNI